MDEINQKIIDTMTSLIRGKGYVAMTAKDIARQAGINECASFRKFRSKQDIVINGMSQGKWWADISEEVSQNVQWEFQPDSEMFIWAYMERIMLGFVNLSIGLRTPQIYSETAPLTMKIPQTFLTVMTGYLEEMEWKGEIIAGNYESLAMTILSSTFGYTFPKAPFQREPTKVEQEEYIKDGVKVFIEGITWR